VVACGLRCVACRSVVKLVKLYTTRPVVKQVKL
jgi:hypothetical protein